MYMQIAKGEYLQPGKNTGDPELLQTRANVVLKTADSFLARLAASAAIELIPQNERHVKIMNGVLDVLTRKI
jgi:siroheme synthase